MYEREILGLQVVDVPEEFGLGMVGVEDRVAKVLRGALKVLGTVLAAERSAGVFLEESAEQLVNFLVRGLLNLALDFLVSLPRPEASRSGRDHIALVVSSMLTPSVLFVDRPKVDEALVCPLEQGLDRLLELSTTVSNGTSLEPVFKVAHP